MLENLPPLNFYESRMIARIGVALTVAAGAVPGVIVGYHHAKDIQHDAAQAAEKLQGCADDVFEQTRDPDVSLILTPNNISNKLARDCGLDSLIKPREFSNKSGIRVAQNTSVVKFPTSYELMRRRQDKLNTVNGVKGDILFYSGFFGLLGAFVFGGVGSAMYDGSRFKGKHV